MADLENTPEVVESTNPTTANAFAEETLLPNTDKVAEAIQKARAQEKDKLYPQLTKLQEEISLLRQEREQRQSLDAQRAEKRKQREAEREAEKKAQAEDEMSFKKLLKVKEEEFQSQLAQERAERERLVATLEMEKQYQELQQYRNSRLEQERDNIIPELVDLISGNTRDEIEQSIAGLKERSAKIFDSVAQVAQQSRKEMVGTRITSPASGPLDNDSDSRTYSPNDISKMSMADYAKNRSKLLGNSNNSGQGLFGNY
jgi:hypothetical protein